MVHWFRGYLVVVSRDNKQIQRPTAGLVSLGLSALERNTFLLNQHWFHFSFQAKHSTKDAQYGLCI